MTLSSFTAQLFPYGEMAGDDMTLRSSAIGPLQLEAPFLYYMKNENVYYVRFGMQEIILLVVWFLTDNSGIYIATTKDMLMYTLA